MPCLPPPAPPPAPPNAWAGRSKPATQPLISASIWPHRLLHVKSMTSYVRAGRNIYNSVEAPSYNVLSYTWGYYQDNAQQHPLLVHGIDWPIPSIKKDHFTTATFQNAIEHAARGVNCPCEWLWVDIACIPQKHNLESKEAIGLRGQEIGRQVEI
ncbi:hypothetical protein BDZ45DRAFT_607411, partial [Acephala macrosclerotiorum]